MKRREAAIERRKAEERLRKAEQLWRASGVPQRHAEQLSELRSDRWLAAYRRASEQLGTGMIALLHGDRGRGKTQMGVALILDACNSLRSCMYLKAARVFTGLRSSFRDGGPTEDEVLDRFRRPALLVIDALEVRGHSDHEYRSLETIIDERYDARRDTVLITNETAEAFADAMGPSIVARINEVGDAVQCDWGDFRSQGDG